MSALDGMINGFLSQLVAIIAIICMAGGIGAVVWINTHCGDATPSMPDAWYMGYHLDRASTEPWGSCPATGFDWLFRTVNNFLIIAQTIPVSLYVSMRGVRFFQVRETRRTYLLHRLYIIHYIQVCGDGVAMV
jgi:hypothetical protein